MKRIIMIIKQCDYTSKEAFEKDVPKMKAKGYTLINEKNGFDKSFYPQAIVDDKWKYTAYYYVSKLG